MGYTMIVSTALTPGAGLKGFVDDIAQNSHASNTRVEKRAAKQLQGEHEVKLSRILHRLLQQQDHTRNK